MNLLCATTKPSLLTLLNSPSFQLLPFFLSVSSFVNFNPFLIFSFSLPHLLFFPSSQLSPLPSHPSPCLNPPCLPP